MHCELFSPHAEETPVSQLLEQVPSGLLYGYSVYTTLKMPISEQGIDLHLQRLKKDCKALGLQWRYTDSRILERLNALFQPGEPVFRLTVCADVESYSDFYAEDASLPSRLLISSRPAPQRPADGVRLKTVSHQRPLPTLKHGAMAETILLKRQARKDGFDDILLMNAQGHACESSTANLFLVRNGQLQTPEPVRDGCLPGITRQLILDGANAQRIPIGFEPVSLNELQSAQGAFLTNATQGLVPVHAIDGQVLPWPSEAKRISQALGHIINT